MYGEIDVTRTYRARVQNHSQVRDDLDSLGFAASKLWNVARWTVGRVWDACGQIPSAFDLQKYLKSHERYADLHSSCLIGGDGPIKSKRVHQKQCQRVF